MLEFKLNEENYFEFEMQITGDADTSAKPIVEFALNLQNGMKMSFIAEKKDSVYAVTLPPMKKYLLESGEHDCTLSVFLGDKFFSPYSGKCSFKEPIQPVISNVKVESKTPESSVKPVISFIQKDKSTALVETVKDKSEETKKASQSLDKLLGKKKGK